MQNNNTGVQRARPFLDLARRELAKQAQGKEEEPKTVDEKAKPQGSPPTESEQTPGHADDKASPAATGRTHEAPTGDDPTPGEPVVTQKAEELPDPIERDYEIAKSDSRKRYTLGPLYVPEYVDAHGEFTKSDIIEDAAWDYVRQGNREINLQHTGQRVGEWVGLLTWPFPVEVEMELPGDQVQKSKKVKFPPGTPFMGVIWDEWAWDKYVEPGLIRGFSMEGWGTRVRVEQEMA